MFGGCSDFGNRRISRALSNDGPIPVTPPTQRTQVLILGAGPSGLVLSHLLAAMGVDNVVLELRSREYVMSRIRAGVLEHGSIELLRAAGLAERALREGFVHEGVALATGDAGFRVDFREHTGAAVTIYGQTELQKDLFRARDDAGGVIVDEVSDVVIHDAESSTPRVTYAKDGEKRTVVADFVAGCDGHHGVSRASFPARLLTTYERVYPFGWLGVLSETPPVSDELVYLGARTRFRSVLDAEPVAVSLLPAVQSGRRRPRVVGRALLGRAARAPAARDRRTPGDGSFDRKEHHAAAELHRRADASWQLVSRRGCSAHRAADRSEGAEPGALRRRLARRRARRALRRRFAGAPRRLLDGVSRARVERRSILVVDDEFTPPLRRRRRVHPPSQEGRALSVTDVPAAQATFAENYVGARRGSPASARAALS